MTRLHTTRRARKRFHGGFIPSVMEGFCTVTSKYVTPLVVLLIHRMMASSSLSRSRSSRPRPTRRRKR